MPNYADHIYENYIIKIELILLNESIVFKK